jgi:hypothetical protein
MIKRREEVEEGIYTLEAPILTAALGSGELEIVLQSSRAA